MPVQTTGCVTMHPPTSEQRKQLRRRIRRCLGVGVALPMLALACIIGACTCVPAQVGGLLIVTYSAEILDVDTSPRRGTLGEDTSEWLRIAKLIRDVSLRGWCDPVSYVQGEIVIYGDGILFEGYADGRCVINYRIWNGLRVQKAAQLTLEERSALANVVSRLKGTDRP